MSDVVASLALAAAAVALLLLALGAGARNGLLLLLAGLPVASLLLIPGVRLYSFHGLMHASLVYQILAGGIPPENPLLAGEPLRYAWGYHLLVALVSRALDATPATSFALVSVAALLLTAFLLFRIAGALTDSRRARTLAVLVSLYGVSATCGGPLAAGLHELTGLALESRALPIVKFLHVNSNQLGILCCALFLHSLLRVFGGREGEARAAYAELFTAVLGAAFFYPLAWAALLASGSAAGAWVALREPGRMLPAAGRALATAALASAVALPYLVAIQAGRSADATVSLEPSAERLLEKSAAWALALLWAAAVGLFSREALGRIWRERPTAVALLLATALTTGALYLLVHAPLRSEYKFLALSLLSLGILAGLCLDALLESHRLVALALLWSALVPPSWALVQSARHDWGNPARILEEGTRLRHASPHEGRLQDWIAAHSQRDAVFVDTALTVPTFGQRSLLVALDPSPRGPRASGALDGWFLPPSILLRTTYGTPPETLRRRQRLARAMLAVEGAAISDEAIAEVRAIAGSSEVFVVAREPALSRRLDGDGRFARTFSTGSVSIYRLVR